MFTGYTLNELYDRKMKTDLNIFFIFLLPFTNCSFSKLQQLKILNSDFFQTTLVVYPPFGSAVRRIDTYF